MVDEDGMRLGARQRACNHSDEMRCAGEEPEHTSVNKRNVPGGHVGHVYALVVSDAQGHDSRSRVDRRGIAYDVVGSER